MTELLRAPLVVFAIVGLVLFGLVRFFDEDRPASKTEADGVIVVERDALLAYVQLRSGEADAAALAYRWDRLDDPARKVWVDRFVREEALVREARRLGLDRDDDLIRRRLVQQMEFLASAETDDAIDEAAIEAAYAAKAEEHRVPAVVTFGHVFIRDEGALASRPSSDAAARAARLREDLDASGVGFDEASARGDRFLYNRVYVDRTLDEVRAHFGPEMAEALTALEPNRSRWQGPIASRHGWHVVLLARRTEERVPALEEIRGALAEEIRRDRREASLERGIGQIVTRYEIHLAPELRAASGSSNTDPPKR